MLNIDLRRLVEGPVQIAGEIAGDHPMWEDTAAHLAGPLTVAARAEAARGEGVWVHGSLHALRRVPCRRCLEPVELELAEEFDLYFDPAADETDEDLALYRLEPDAEELDLRPAIRERTLLTVAKFPVCREDCRGLCPRCGANLNERACECEERESDPRWAPLRALQGGV